MKSTLTDLQANKIVDVCKGWLVKINRKSGEGLCQPDRKLAERKPADRNRQRETGREKVGREKTGRQKPRKRKPPGKPGGGNCIQKR
ncbi:hypothetical protein PQG65_07305 [Corynebacterium pseudodiphtheriticum]|uniref:hypothetical protein n=1 Tax=Corynebacterium pseudodiphtheriticum TaxID=37637 RepID=UPI00234DC608|nr:hypothetical protein [Corynebacterium pseudodiphtheriticum]MDC7111177.1 hypothetical protein [Corynebacterium pseudodiphtheriticum]